MIQNLTLLLGKRGPAVPGMEIKQPGKTRIVHPFVGAFFPSVLVDRDRQIRKNWRRNIFTGKTR